MIKAYSQLIQDSFVGYFNYLTYEIAHPHWTNYFYWLIALSLLVLILEVIIPWRNNQKVIRKGFWLDCFYIFFNFFIFSLIGYNALSNVAVNLFNEGLAAVGIDNIVAIEIQSFPVWAQLLVMFVVADFLQWFVHVQLHKWPQLWKFHKVHHSVQEMGFAAHFRFHFMETIIYKSAQYIPLAMIGFGIEQFFFVHMFSVLVGHLNHANLSWDYGWLGYLFNNPKMHIWHHSKDLPDQHKHGMNFGISLSVWDYLFHTAYIPKDGQKIQLGFKNVEQYPQDFLGQLTAPFKEKSQT